jgi:hypothetical protein
MAAIKLVRFAVDIDFMSTVRYIACGAATGYVVVALTYGLLQGSAALLLIPVSMIGGGYIGYRNVQNKRLRMLLNAKSHATHLAEADLSQLPARRVA